MKTRNTTIVVILAVTAACSNDDERAKKQKECDDIAANIREKATTQYGQPAQSACSNPALKPTFDKACAALAQCNAEVKEM
jgi:hypothetical protein